MFRNNSFFPGEDSTTMNNIAFSMFLDEYRVLCDHDWTSEKIVIEAKCRWSEMEQVERKVFLPEYRPKQGSSLISVMAEELLEKGHASSSRVAKIRSIPRDAKREAAKARAAKARAAKASAKARTANACAIARAARTSAKPKATPWIAKPWSWAQEK